MTGELGHAVAGAELLVCAVPAQHLRSLIESIDVVAPLVLNVAKGLEEGTCMRMSEVLAEALPGRDPSTIGVLSGPNLAREIVAGPASRDMRRVPRPRRGLLGTRAAHDPHVARVHERRRDRL